MSDSDGIVPGVGIGPWRLGARAVELNLVVPELVSEPLVRPDGVMIWFNDGLIDSVVSVHPRWSYRGIRVGDGIEKLRRLGDVVETDDGVELVGVEGIMFVDEDPEDDSWGERPGDEYTAEEDLMRRHIASIWVGDPDWQPSGECIGAEPVGGRFTDGRRSVIVFLIAVCIALVSLAAAVWAKNWPLIPVIVIGIVVLGSILDPDK